MKTMPWLCLVALVACGTEGKDGTPSGALGLDTTSSVGLCFETLPSCSSDPTFDATLIEWTKAATVIFRGTVTQLNASTVSSLPPEGLFLVHVDQELTGNSFAANFVGQEITVSPPSSLTVTVGTNAYFFANGWMIGDGFAVTEVGHADPGIYPNIEVEVPAIKSLLVDRQVYGNLMVATAIFRGTVTTVGAPIATSIGSEHDPLWADATVAAECTLHDTRDEGTAASEVVRFPSSMDVMWYESPKPVTNDTSIFVIHSAGASYPMDAGTLPGTFSGVLVQQRDVWAPDEANYLLELLTCPPPAL